MRFFYTVLLILVWHNAWAENVLKPVFQFILNNEKLCGDQFRDALWLPALEECQTDCDISSQVCQYRIDNKYPGQRCQRLPIDCIMEIKRMLDLDFDTPALQLPLAPLTTPPPTMAPIILPFQPDIFSSPSNQIENFPRKQHKVLGIPSLPQAAVPFSNTHKDAYFYGGSYDDPTTTVYPTVDVNGYKTASMLSYYGEYTTTTTQPEFVPQEAAIRVISYDSAVEPSNYPVTTPSPIYDNRHELDNNNVFITSNMPDDSPDYENERNLEPDQILPPSIKPNDNAFQFQSNNEVGVPDNVGFFGPPDNMINKIKSSTSYPILASPTRTWENRSPILAEFETFTRSPIIDYSARCCQWAIDGLCDSSWQRIRKLCPKSCGAVYCSDASGSYACYRAIEVNVIECFQQRRKLYHAHGSKTLPDKYYSRESVLPQSEAKTFQQKIVQSNKKSKLLHLKSVQPDYERAYAVENEMQSWSIFG